MNGLSREEVLEMLLSNREYYKNQSINFPSSEISHSLTFSEGKLQGFLLALSLELEELPDKVIVKTQINKKIIYTYNKD